MKTKLRLRNLLFGVYVVLCLGAVCWPGYAWFGSSITPYVLGLPFSLAWVVGWVLLTFVLLSVYHATGEREAGRTPGNDSARSDS